MVFVQTQNNLNKLLKPILFSDFVISLYAWKESPALISAALFPFSITIKTIGRLTMQRTPVFSSYRKLRHTQPDQYFTLDIQRRMYQDQKDVGLAFFDLMYEVKDESV